MLIVYLQQLMQEPISPQEFLFQNLVTDMLEHCKKNLKIAPFEDMNVKELVKSNKKQRIDLYHQYFLIGISHNKTRQIVTKHYDRLIRENLINKDFLPPQMISGIVNARPNVSSTASSGSMAGSSSHLAMEKSVHIGKLITTIICSSIQPSTQITVGLNFMLEGTRSKNYSSFFYSLIEQVYKSLIKYRQKPANRFVKLFLGNIINEVEYHKEQPNFVFINRKYEQKHEKICIHEGRQAKFGKCFVCEKDAKNYDKLLLVPLCSIQCKNRLKHINEQCIMNDHFNIFAWLMEVLPQGDQIIYELLFRQIQEVQLQNQKISSLFLHLSGCLSQEYLATGLQQNALLIFSHLVKKYKLIHQSGFFEKIKVFIFEIIRLVEITPVTLAALPRFYLLKALVSLIEDQSVLLNIFFKCDCSLFQYNIIERILNPLSQYAMANEAQLRQFGIKGIQKLLKTLVRLPPQKKADEKTRRKIVEKRKKNSIYPLMDPFNNQSKKPEKVMVEIKKNFEDKLSERQIALLIRQNLDYDAQIKKKQTFKKDRVGEYFSVQSAQVQNIYSQFLSFIDFQGLQGDDILRIVFNLFTLPKQGQRIERIFVALSKLCQPLLGLEAGDHTYLYLYLLLMTHTSNANKNVKEDDKIKLQSFLKLCGKPTDKDHIKGLDDERKVNVYNRIVNNPLENRYPYKGEEFFTKKYLTNVEYETRWMSEEAIENAESPYCCLLTNIWEYIYVSIVNKNNIKGLHEACLVFGKAGLRTEFEAFFSHIFKIYEHQKGTLSHESLLTVLQLGVDTGNYTLGVSAWFSVIKAVYKLDENTQNQSKLKASDYEYEVSDRLFTRTRQLHPQRLKEFLQAICEFSSSQLKTDIHYTRQLYTLHHIAEVIEYNLFRLSVIWENIWGTLSIYFRNICLHPKKEIAMSAIDSFKQFTMKAFKLQEGVDHGQVMEAYLYIFQRSNSFMKDLIINILLNVVSKDMNSGWDSLYTILQVVDSEDQGVVMRVIHRLLTDLNLNRIGNLQRLHAILVKQLRIGVEENQQILSRLWEVSNHFNNLQIWVETLKCAKDIYKIRENNNILEFVYKICNNCALMLQDQPNKRVEQQLYEQILQVQIFITQIKNQKLFSEAIQKFNILSIQIVLKNLGGFLSYWQKFYLNSNYFQTFSYFISRYISILYDEIVSRSLEQAAKQICFWLSKLFISSYPDELFRLCSLDTDLNLGIQAVFHKGITSNKVELIQFALSSRQYRNKVIIHLVMTEMLRMGYEKGIVQLAGECKQRIEENIIQSYGMGKKINNKVILRNFLWNNEFLKSNEENNYLPTFEKIQLRSYHIILKYAQFSSSRINEICYGMMVEYVNKMSLYSEKSAKSKSSSQLQDLLFQDIGLWITNAAPLILETICKYIEILGLPPSERKEIHPLSDILQVCLEINTFPVDRKILKQNVNLINLLIEELY